MELSTTLQVAGAGFELAGLVLVAMGIAETRQQFAPELPGVVGRLRNAGSWVVVRLPWCKKNTKVVVGAASMSFGGGDVRVRGTVGLGSWEDVPIERQVLDLRRMFEAQATELDQLHRERKAQETKRAAGEQELRDRLTGLQGALDRVIKMAATSGLGRETWGVACFALGLALGTVGNVMG